MPRIETPRPRGTPCWLDLMSPDVKSAKEWERVISVVSDPSGATFSVYVPPQPS